MKTRMLIPMVLVLAGAFAAAAMAGENKGPGPCKADGEKFCPGMQPGDGKFGKCLNSHMTELAPECRQAREKSGGQGKGQGKGPGSQGGKQGGKQGGGQGPGVPEVCKPDFEKFCKHVQPGEGRVGACFQSHQNELSPACKDLQMQNKGKTQGGKKGTPPVTKANTGK